MRSRHLLTLLALPALVLLYLYHTTIADLFSTSADAPPEIFGLLHFTTSPDEAQRVITTPNMSDPPSNELGGPITPEHPVDMAWYALGSLTKAPRREASGWDARLRALPPLVVFSKTYCPYSKRAKQLLKAYDLSPAPKIVEVDLRPDGAHVKTLLMRLTHQSTFPNVILHGRSLGGSDDLVRLHKEGALRGILEQSGIEVRWAGEDVKDL